MAEIDNAGTKWSKVDNERFIQMLKSDMSFEDMAKNFGRTSTAMAARRDYVIASACSDGATAKEVSEMFNTDVRTVEQIVNKAFKKYHGRCKKTLETSTDVAFLEEMKALIDKRLS